MDDFTAHQSQITDDQDLDVNIDKIYNNFIVEIDKIRSHVSVNDNPSFNTINLTTSNQISINLNIDNQPQESRCNAFYRLLGLPITDGTVLYTPGFDKENNNDADLNKTKTTVAQNILNNIKLKILLDNREEHPKSFLSIFSTQDVNAMVLAMSLADIRPFDVPLGKSAASVNGGTFVFDTNLNNQIYPTEMAQRLAQNVINNNVKADVDDIGQNRAHFLLPLIVDPRIDLNMYPRRNRLSVPFVTDKTGTMLAPDIFLKRPYIEKVCRDRFNTNSIVTSYGGQTQDIINNIINNSKINNDTLIKQAFNPNNITNDTVQFANYLNSIRSVLKTLYESVSKVTPVLAADPASNGIAKFNWVPVPNVLGPEKGSTTRDLLTGQPTDSKNTVNDNKLVNLLYKQSLANISNKLTDLESPNPGNFAFDGLELTPDKNSSDSFDDLHQPNIDSLTNERSNATDAANDAIKIIEIIMGEFSGIGLIDILVISAAFWVIDKPSLLGLLDNTAINRMSLNPNLQAQEVKDRQANNGISIGTAILNFQNKVKEIYDVTAQLWEQIKTQNQQ